jgi:hypothetical protein
VYAIVRKNLPELKRELKKMLWTALLENLRIYSYFVMGKSKILFLLRNGKTFGFIPTM